MPPNPSKPTALPVSPAAIPDVLKAIPHWVVWRYAWSVKKQKWDKPPLCAHTLTAASPTNSHDWVDYETALSVYLSGEVDGLGFALTDALGFVGIDLDECRNPETGSLDVLGQHTVEDVPTYWEVSPSGTGLRGFALGTLPPYGRKKGDVEMYSGGRYLTITGCHLADTPSTIEACQDAITAVHARFFPAPEPTAPPSMNGNGPTMADESVLEHARRAQNGGKFMRLWSGDTSEHGGDDSVADLALCMLLAFWTQDAAQIDRLFRQSERMREKWDERRGDQTYGERTIATALARQTEHYRERRAGATQASAATPLPLSEVTNAEALVRAHGETLHYCHPSKQWYIWDGKRWLADETAAVMRLAKQTVKAMAARVQDIADDQQAKAWMVHIKSSLSTSRLKGMVEAATWEPIIPVLPGQLDQDPWLLNCLNGTLDLRTGELQPHRREDLITCLAPVHYDPRATSKVWDAFLRRILPDESVRRYVQKAAGYSLTGLGTEEVLFFPFGPTKTGKSTLLKALRATMGDYATTADFETFLARDHVTGSPRADIADLAGKRLVVSLEVDQGKRLAEGLIKWLFGGDYVKARFLYKREFEFLPSFKLWLAANHRPQVRPDDDAIWERIRQIPFGQSIPREERDPGIKAELSDPEQSGAAILAWAVEGCLLWQREGLGAPKEVDESTQDYRREMDPLPDFLEACVTPGQSRVLNAPLWESYQSWSRKNPDRPRLGRKTFTQRLEARGFDSIESGGHRYWLGMRLRYTSSTDDTL